MLLKVELLYVRLKGAAMIVLLSSCSASIIIISYLYVYSTLDRVVHSFTEKPNKLVSAATQQSVCTAIKNPKFAHCQQEDFGAESVRLGHES
jgi:hypothetical protein